jgi:cell division septum initiation protein DivIVA
VNDLAMPDQGLLGAQLAQANERLESLAQKLRAVDAELKGISEERRRYELLQDACDALDKLSKIGASDLFWGEGKSPEEGDAFVRVVRKRMEGFLGRLSEIEERREDLLGEIRKEQETIEILEEDLFDAQQQEERRKLEWIVEREISALPARKIRMPWSHGGEEDRRFLKSLSVSLLLCVLLALLVPLIDLPIPERWEDIEVPERLARLVEEQRFLPPPSVIEEPVPDVPEPEPEPEPEPVDEPMTLTDQPVLAQDPTPKSQPQKAEPKKPESKGILAFREQFSAAVGGASEDQQRGRGCPRAHATRHGDHPGAGFQRRHQSRVAQSGRGRRWRRWTDCRRAAHAGSEHDRFRWRPGPASERRGRRRQDRRGDPDRI